ncbi:MAG TPA: VanZ family protein [Quisquiliibacterium sp.]|nr:VanZ family protein [Quisquiliibacterium sp.]
MPVEPSNRRSRFPEVLLGAYLLALVYGTLYPWTGWRSTGLPGLGFLTDPWPRWWTWLDVLVNVAVYVPLGALAAVLARRRLGVAAAVIAAAAFASLASLTLEGLQSFLPGRVASRLDWIANTGGAVAGALIAAALSRLPPLFRGRWLRASLHGAAGATGFALLASWIAIQLPPQRVPFGSGDFAEPLLAALSVAIAPLSRALDPGMAGADAAGWLAAQAANLRLGVDHIVLIEACGTASAVAAVGLLVREMCPAAAPRGSITALLVLGAAAARSASAALLLGPEQAFSWLTAGAQGGLVLGAVVLGVLASGRRRARLRWAIAAIALTALLTSVFPADPYHASMLQRWDRGAWRNFDGLLEAAALAWPFAAILWCSLRLRALRAAGTSMTRSDP